MTESEKTYCGYVAIVGRPNVGKSTLLNAILGQKVSITSRKPQTTRNQILGIKSQGARQTIYIDTPGLHLSAKKAINRYMNRTASAAVHDVDVVVFMIDSIYWKDEEDLVLSKLQEVKCPIILVLNKMDTLKDKTELLPFIDKLKLKLNFLAIIPLSAQNKEGVAALENQIAELLPENPHFFPDEQITDRDAQFQVAELIREKLLRATGQEVPYSTAIQIENFKIGEKLVEIDAIIWVERDGQKAIIIGEAGNVLKKIGTQARHDMEALLKQKVFLRLWVKLKANWTNSEILLKNFGYTSSSE